MAGLPQLKTPWFVRRYEEMVDYYQEKGVLYTVCGYWPLSDNIMLADRLVNAFGKLLKMDDERSLSDYNDSFNY